MPENAHTSLVASLDKWQRINDAIVAMGEASPGQDNPVEPWAEIVDLPTDNEQE